LVDGLTTLLRGLGLRVGIIAVDPTSPFTGGALLGDRIRMQNHAVDKGVFIRSMGTRGSLGGLAYKTKEVVKAMDSFGFDWVIVETVGVGQAELEIMNTTDSVVVVLTPGSGDSIQAIKAGIMEIADVFAVNKSDLAGADNVVREVEVMLDLQMKPKPWRPPVVKTSLLTGEGLKDLLNAVEKHRDFLLEKNIRNDITRERLKSETLQNIERICKQIVQKQISNSGEANRVLELVSNREIDTYTAGGLILKHIAAGITDSINNMKLE